MATVINNPSSTDEGGSNMLIGVVLAIVIVGAAVVFFMYGLPMIQNNSNQNPGDTNINVTLPNADNAPNTNNPPSGY